MNGPGVLPAGTVRSRVALEKALAGLRRYFNSEAAGSTPPLSRRTTGAAALAGITRDSIYI
jgi:hypothetical protein